MCNYVNNAKPVSVPSAWMCVHMQVAGSALHLDEQRLWWDDLLCPERDGDSEKWYLLVNGYRFHGGIFLCSLIEVCFEEKNRKKFEKHV